MKIDLRGRFARSIVGVIAAIAAMLIGMQAVADQPMQNVTVGALGIKTNPDGSATSYVVDMNRRDPTSNCPFIYLLMHHVYMRSDIPVVQQYKTYPAVVAIATDGSSTLHSIVINGTSYDVGLTQSWVCSSRPGPDGGHWEWVNDGFMAKPGVADPVQWQPAAGNGGNAAGVQMLTPNVDIENQLDSEVTVTMDGQPGCTARPHRHCYFHAPLGMHNFRATSPAVDEPATESHMIKQGETFDWAIWLQH